jgi:hypothetical protein|nr:MAG TPA: hypothetical protein [Caudoviricetes sp.]
MELTVAKFGVERIPANKEAILRHREMPLIDILLEKKTSLSYRDISYGYDVGTVAKHVNRPLVELVSKENHPRPACYDIERESALAMEEHAKLWATPESFKHTDEIIGLVNRGSELTLMRGMIPQPISQIGMFQTYIPDYSSRIVYGVYIEEHEKFGLKDPFDSQHIFYNPTNVTTKVVESNDKMVCLSHSNLAITTLYREATYRLDKYFPDVNPDDYVKVVAIDITDMVTGFLSDHADNLEYYVGQNGWWRFVNINTLSDYIQSYHDRVVKFDFKALSGKEGIKVELGEEAHRKFNDVRFDDCIFTSDADDDTGGYPKGEATISIEYLTDKEEDVFTQRLTPYRAVVKFKTEDRLFVPDVSGMSIAISHGFFRSILKKHEERSALSFHVDDPMLDNVTSDGFVKATQNELIFYGVIVSGVKDDLMSKEITVDGVVSARRKLITYLQHYADENRLKWVGLTDLIRQNVPVDERARFYGMAMEIIRIENNSDIVNDFTYRWLDGYVYLAYVGRINDIEITTDDINRLRSKLASPVIDDSKLTNLKRLKFVRDAEHHDEVLYGWDWFYILEDGKYRKVKGYVLTKCNEVRGSVNPNQGARVTLKDVYGVATTLFIDPYRLSKGLVVTDALAPVGGVYQLDDYRYIQVIV